MAKWTNKTLSPAEYSYCIKNKLCLCGGFKPKEAQYDARGIFLCYTCEKCHDTVMTGYRPDVLTDPNYWHDEPIGGD